MMTLLVITIVAIATVFGASAAPQHGREQNVVEDFIPEGYVRFGDMLIPVNATPGTRNMISFPQYRWPLGIIPYEIDDSLSEHSGIIAQAFREYLFKTCIKFLPRTIFNQNYVRIFAGNGCYSSVGLINQGLQPVSLGTGCLDYGTIVHELGHTVGFFHEQNRSDRDDYLNIYWGNITEGMEDQFAKLDPSHNLLINGFDVDSIMLYGEYAFSWDGWSKTMEHKLGYEMREVYEKPGLSPADVERINVAYGCQLDL